VLVEPVTGELAFDDPDAEEIDDVSDAPTEVREGPRGERRALQVRLRADRQRLGGGDYPQLATTAPQVDELRPLPRSGAVGRSNDPRLSRRGAHGQSVSALAKHRASALARPRAARRRHGEVTCQALEARSQLERLFVCRARAGP
jgi:hypothetical protein